MQRHFRVLCAAVSLFALAGCGPRPAVTADAKPPAAAAKQVEFASFNELHGFVVGTGQSAVALPRAYVLFDPQCPHCAKLWEAAKPLRASAAIKWIPVGILSATSRNQSAMLLESKDPVSLMNANEATFAATGRASQVTTTVADETLGWVGGNNLAMATIGATSVPTLIYRKKGETSISTASGEMTTPQIAELLGITAGAAPSVK